MEMPDHIKVYKMRRISWSDQNVLSGWFERIVNLNKDRFVHRGAFKRAPYKSQTYSQNTRKTIRIYEGIVAWDKRPQEYFRPFSKSKPTCTLKRLLKKQVQAEGLTLEELAVL